MDWAVWMRGWSQIGILLMLLEKGCSAGMLTCKWDSGPVFEDSKSGACD